MSKERLFEVMGYLDKGFKPKLNEEKMKGEDPCWDDHEMVGMKKKDGKEVPNCVPKNEGVGGNIDDPTKEEMVEFLKSKYHTEDDFDVESAIYWFANDYHGGQSSNLYSALSTSEFRPGPMHRGIEDEESEMATMMYRDLEDKYAGGGQEPEPEVDNSEWMGLSMNEEEKWMQDAVKRPGALHKKLGIPEDQEIPMELINKKLAELKKKSEGDKTLSKEDLRFQRQLNFAKNAKNINETMKQDSSKKMLLEAMHKVAGMPLNEEKKQLNEGITSFNQYHLDWAEKESEAYPQKYKSENYDMIRDYVTQNNPTIAELQTEFSDYIGLILQLIHSGDIKVTVSPEELLKKQVFLSGDEKVVTG